MAPKKKLKTPDWILKGGKKPTNKKEEKTFNVRKCPECDSDDVGIVLGGEEGKGSKGWECRHCKWAGKNIVEKILTEDEFLKYLDERGEEVA